MATEILIWDLIKLAKENLKFLWRNILRILLVSIFFAVLIAALFSFCRTIRYTSTTTLINENTGSSKLTSYSNLANLAGIDLGAANANLFEGDNLLELFKSKKLVTKTLLSRSNKNDLFINWFLISHKIKGNPINADASVDSRNQDSLINMVTDEVIDNHVNVRKADKKNDLVIVDFSDENETFAKEFLDKLVENSINYFVEYKTKKNLGNVQVLQEQVDSLRQVLFENIDGLASNSDENINLVKQAGKIAGQKNQIAIQSSSSVYTEMLKNLEMAKLTLLKEKPFIQIVDESKLPLHNSKVSSMLIGAIGFILAFAITSIFFLYKLNRPKAN